VPKGICTDRIIGTFEAGNEVRDLFPDLKRLKGKRKSTTYIGCRLGISIIII